MEEQTLVLERILLNIYYIYLIYGQYFCMHPFHLHRVAVQTHLPLLLFNTLINPTIGKPYNYTVHFPSTALCYRGLSFQ